MRLSDLEYLFPRELSVASYEELTQRVSSSAALMLKNDPDGWYIYDGDLWVDEDLLVDRKLVVTGNITISGTYKDSEGALIVQGNLRCHHMFSTYSLIILGNLVCGGFCYQFYNDHILSVSGSLSAYLFISEDKTTEINDKKIDYIYPSEDEWMNRYQLFGIECPKDYDPDDYETDSDEDNVVNIDAARRLFAQRQKNKEDVFITSLPSIEDLEKRWGSEWAWYKRLWYPHKTTTKLTNEEITLLSTSKNNLLTEVILSKHLPSEMFIHYINHPSSDVRWALASSPDCTKDCLLKLSQDQEEIVRTAVAKNKICPEQLHLKLANDESELVRMSVLLGLRSQGEFQSNEQLLEKLSQDESSDVRCAVALTPDLPNKLKNSLLEDKDASVVFSILRFQDVDLDSFIELADHISPRIRHLVAQYAFSGKAPFNEKDGRCIGRSIMEKLMLDPDQNVREAAANAGLSPTFFEENSNIFMMDKSPLIRRMLVWKSRDPVVLENLSKDGNYNVRHDVAVNPNTSPEILIKMCLDAKQAIVYLDESDPKYTIFKKCGMDPGTILTNDAEKNVNMAQSLSKNPMLPERAIEILLVIQEEQKIRLYDDLIHMSSEQILKCLLYIIQDKVTDCCSQTRKKYEKQVAQLQSYHSAGIAKFFDYLFKNASYSNNYSQMVLKSVHCNPELLLERVKHFLVHFEEKEQGGLQYDIEFIAANPALTDNARQLLIQKLEESYSYKVCAGLCRNPSVTAEEFMRLTENSYDSGNKRNFIKALWLWHGIDLTEKNNHI